MAVPDIAAFAKTGFSARSMQIECQDCGARFRADIRSGARSGADARCPRCRSPRTRGPEAASGQADSGPWGSESETAGASEPDDPLRRAEVLKILREEAEFAEAAKRTQPRTTSNATETASGGSAAQPQPVVKRTSDAESVRRRGTSRSDSERDSPRKDESSGWLRAAAIMLIALLAIATFAYNYSSEIIERIPAAAPYLESFTRAVDDAWSHIAELI